MYSGASGSERVRSLICRFRRGVVARCRRPVHRLGVTPREAPDTVLNRTVAIKFLYLKVTLDDEARRRFLRESRTTAALQHAHIVAIYALQLDAEIPYLA